MAQSCRAPASTPVLGARLGLRRASCPGRDAERPSSLPPDAGLSVRPAVGKNFLQSSLVTAGWIFFVSAGLTGSIALATSAVFLVSVIFTGSEAVVIEEFSTLASSAATAIEEFSFCATGASSVLAISCLGCTLRARTGARS